MIELEAIEPLTDPIVIAAFEGWNDAGGCATGVIEHLSSVWSADLVAAMDPEDYYDFQVNRPKVSFVDGKRSIEWPTTRVMVIRDSPVGCDIVLILGIEPSVRWRSYSSEIVAFAVHHDAAMLITLGGLLADVPHTRPIPVGVTSEDAGLRELSDDIERSSYEGPVGIVGILHDHAQQVALPSLSCWAAVPHYAGGAPSPKASLALLGRLEDLLSCVIDDTELVEQARAWERGVDELAESDDEVREYVTSLEEAQDTADLPEASGDAIAKEFERYLQRRDETGPPTP